MTTRSSADTARFSSLLTALLTANLAGQGWVQTAPATGPWPTAIAYDPLRDRTVAFGGTGGYLAPPNSDTWEYDAASATWTQRSPLVVPPARDGHAMVFDARRGRIVLFGGYGFDDTWEYDGNAWQQIPTSQAPSPRGAHAMAYDLRRGCIVLFAGQDATGAVDDTWVFDSQLADWSPVATPTAPGARYEHAMTYDAGQDRFLMFGDAGCPQGYMQSQVWQLDPSTFTWTPIGNGPTQPCHIAMAYDSHQGRVVCVGGGNIVNPSGETWALEPGSSVWAQAAPTPSLGSFASRTHNLTYDEKRGRAVMLSAGTVPWSPAQTWELPPPALPKWSAYGTGCAGSAGVPELRPAAASTPALGSVLQLEASNLAPAAGSAVLAHGFRIGAAAGAPLPQDLAAVGLPGCLIWIDPALLTVRAHAGGTHGFPIAIPNQPALAGLILVSQLLSLDPAASNGLGAVSNAGIATIR